MSRSRRQAILVSRHKPIALGSFEPGSYAARVIVDDTLAKNLAFVIE